MRIARFTLAPLALAAASLSLALAAATPAIAQAPAEPAAINFSIASQPLGRALNELARQANLQLSFPAPLVAGKTAPAVSGRLAPRQALERLLAGSGLEATWNGSAVLVRPATAAAPAPVAAAPDDLASLPVVHVLASASKTDTMADGRLGRSGRLGMLGDVDFMETPFSISSFTSELLRDRQIRELRDLIVLEPSAANGAPRTYSMGGLTLRGFSAVQRFAGLKIMGGMWGGPDIQTDAYDRIEIVKGASAVLNGGFDGLGGTVNLEPKRADDAPLTRLAARAETQSLLGGHVDIGRRFGADNEFGVRVNASGVRGDAAIDDEQRRYWLSSVALDYRGKTVRAALDLISQHNEMKGFQNFYGGSLYTVVSGEVPAPRDVSAGVNSKYDAPKNRKHYAEARGAIGQFEVDLGAATLLRVAHGKLNDVYNAVWHSYLPGSSATTATADAYEAGRGASRYGYGASNASLSHELEAGGLRHRLSAMYDAASFDYGGGPGDTIAYTLPKGQFDGAPDPAYFARGPFTSMFYAKERSIGIGDSFGPRNDDWRVVAGVRRQQAKTRGWDGESFSNGATSISAGALFRLSQPLAVYANYAEGLEAGSMVPPNDGMGSIYDNAGQVIPAYRTKQYEAGLKYDGGKLGATAALFQLARPSVITTRVNATTLHQSVDGEQRNRGLEFSVFGEPTSGLRLLSGLALLDPRLTRTENSTNNGRVAPNSARRSLSLSADWDVPAVAGLTVNGSLIHKSRQFIDATNAAWIKAYTTVDLGLLYTVPTAKPLRLALNLSNAFDRNYWASGSAYGDPRTVKLSVSVDL